MANEGQLDLRLGPSAQPALTVTQLVRAVSQTLEDNIEEFWVEGEVSNSRIPASGHFYFTLKDDRSSISVVMFKGAFSRLKFRVADGMAMLVRGRVNLFEARGQLQVIAAEMQPRGVGALQVAFEQLKKRLEAEGLFDPAHKRPLPFLPRVIGIVTARAGAGLKDILRVLGDRFPDRHLIFRPVKVQGDGAAEEIAGAIDDLNQDGRADVIIVGRGGGSIEDLWAFNEEPVARAIYRSRIPIISAVGHEIDFTIADFVADFRAPTPTAAAQSAVPSKAELRERIEAANASLVAAMERELAGWRERLDDFASRLRHPALLIRRAREEVIRCTLAIARAMRERARAHRFEIEHAETRIRAGIAAIAAARRHRLAELAGRLDSLSPLKVLERGYSVVTNTRDGHVVLDAAAVDVGDELDIRVMKGRLRARTTARET